MKRIAIPICLLVIFISFNQSVLTQEPEKKTTTQEAEYLAIQADLFNPQTLRADKAATETITAFLEKIRSDYVEVKKIETPEFHMETTGIIIRLKRDSAAKIICRDHMGRNWYGRLETRSLDISGIDEITERFHGTYYLDCEDGRPIVDAVRVRFPGILHVPSLGKLYQDCQDVLAFAEDSQLTSVTSGGETTRIRVSRMDGHWRVTFCRWKDEPTGVIRSDYFFFVVRDDGAISKDGEWSQELKRGKVEEHGRKPWKP